ncbi:MAG: PadR family transcriptional regulator [Desulfobacterales bacterium]|nr:PadR family transcriptional regulator [Desulfobacterales bacterium]
MAEKNFFSGLEYLVLLSILKFNGDGYGVIIHEEICEQTGKDVAYGAVYKALKGLLAKGFVSASKGEPTAERGGRAKTYYKIEGDGIEALRDYESSVERIKQGVPGLVMGVI